MGQGQPSRKSNPTHAHKGLNGQHPYNGHTATILPWLLSHTQHFAHPDPTPFRVKFDEGGVDITLYGELDHVEGAQGVVVAIHGLGGSAQALYCHQISAAARARGLACLRISCRGAQQRGEGLHHAGLYQDIARALASPELADFAWMGVIGCSLGGHMAIRLSEAQHTPRLRGVVALCPPIDLAHVTHHMGKPKQWLYQRHVLQGLLELYPALVARNRDPVPLDRMMRVRTVCEWDALLTAPCFGFHDVWHYYEDQSVSTRVHSLHHPTLVAASPHDPMIPSQGFEQLAARNPEGLHAHWIPFGGHIFFPRRSSIEGLNPQPDRVFGQCVQWLTDLA